MQKLANAKAVEAMFLALEKTASYREMEKLAYWDSVKDLGGRTWDSAKSYLSNAGKSLSELSNAAGNLVAAGGHKLKGAVADAYGRDDEAKQERAIAEQKWNNMKQHGQQYGTTFVQKAKDLGKTLAYGVGTASALTPVGPAVHNVRGLFMNKPVAAPTPAPASQPVAAPTTPAVAK